MTEHEYDTCTTCGGTGMQDNFTEEEYISPSLCKECLGTGIV